MTIEEILKEYPDLELEDIQASLNYIEELHEITEGKLPQIYDVIHYFRLQPRTPGLLKGKLGDAFFGLLPDDEL